MILLNMLSLLFYKPDSSVPELFRAENDMQMKEII